MAVSWIIDGTVMKTLTERQLHLIAKCKETGYGWKKYALSVESQGWDSPSQEEVLVRMWQKINHYECVKAGNIKPDVGCWDSDISDAEAYRSGDHFQGDQVKNTKLRSMIVDCLVHYKRTNGYWYERPSTSQILRTVNTNIGLMSAQDCLELCKEYGKNPRDVYIEPQVFEDCDGYPEYQLDFYTTSKATDEEYYEEIAQALSPSWEKQRYDQYLQYKEEFEC